MLSKTYCCTAQHYIWVFSLKQKQKGRLIRANRLIMSGTKPVGTFADMLCIVGC